MDSLPPYTVRESSRARHPSLRASVRAGLVAVVPVGFDRRRIPELLHRHRVWVGRVLKRLERDRPLLLPGADEERPTTIELRALGERWSVEYLLTRAKGVAAREAQNLLGERVLHLRGAVGNRRACRAALARWLHLRAVATLGTWLQQVSQELHLPFRRVSIRHQSTRWGSCSRAGAISLNRTLLFLPTSLVRYVLIHELCHTVEPNHGSRFWERVSTYVPEWKRIRSEVRTAWRYVPSWSERPS